MDNTLDEDSLHRSIEFHYTHDNLSEPSSPDSQRNYSQHSQSTTTPNSPNYESNSPTYNIPNSPIYHDPNSPICHSNTSTLNIPHTSHLATSEHTDSKPYYFYSQVNRDQLQVLIDKERKTKDCPSEPVKMQPIEPMKVTQPIVISGLPLENSNMGNVVPQNYISTSPFGPIAFTTFQNPIPMVQSGNTIIAFHPMSSFTAFPTQFTHFFSPTMLDGEFRYMGKNKKRPRSSSSSVERERRVRPKVVPEKGAVQCKGHNRKKNTQCRNAALMEFIGPRPMYCAEHIDLDPSCLYTKCCSPFHKTKDDEKGCREVVLKEFKYCHKHYSLAVEEMLNKGPEGMIEAEKKLERAKSLLQDLELEANKAKRSDPDLFQRKHKLIPKFQQILRTLQKHIQSGHTGVTQTLN